MPANVRVRFIPSEIAAKIMSHLHDLPTLYEIVYTVNSQVVEHPIWFLLRPYINRHPLQIQLLVRKVISERYGILPPSQDLLTHVRSHLKNLDPVSPCMIVRTQGDETKQLADPPLQIFLSPHDPAKILFEMNNLSDDLDFLGFYLFLYQLVKAND